MCVLQLYFWQAVERKNKGRNLNHVIRTLKDIIFTTTITPPTTAAVTNTKTTTTTKQSLSQFL